MFAGRPAVTAAQRSSEADGGRTGMRNADSTGRGLAQRHGMLIILTGIYAINFLDRQVLVILLQDIKLEFTLTDSQLGLLSGFAFVAIYVTMGVPAAYIADRRNRARLISIALGFWSAMTALCGMAQSFLQLALARGGVGIGESACTPAAHSMIADRYPPERRATALAVYGTGLFIGSFLGLALGGLIADAMGWRMAFILVGAPGIAVALVTWFFLDEPSRQAQGGDREMSFLASTRALWLIPAFRWYVMGGALAAFAAGAILTWLPVLLIRQYGVSKSEIGPLLGLITGLGGACGAIGFGVLADKLGKRDRRWNLWLCTALFALAAPATAFAFVVDELLVTLLVGAVPIVLAAGFTAPLLSVTQQSVPSNLHAMVTAMVFLVNNLVGFGLGPLAVGALSDQLAPGLDDAAALSEALFWVFPAFALAAVLMAAGAKRLPREGLLT